MSLFLSIGEAMVELSEAGGDLWQLGFAGDTLNTAWYARACLPQDWRVAYFTRLGSDPFSPRMIDFMAANGIETDLIRRDPGRSVGLYSIQLQDGERSFAYWRGQSAARGLADDPATLQEAMARADVVYLSGITLAILPPEGRRLLIDLVGQARAAGRITAFDPNIRPRLWESGDALRATLTAAGAVATIALPSFDDEQAAFGDADPSACVRRWQEAGAGEVVVKNGGGPISIGDDAGLTTIAVDRATPVDSTGAGDSFNGAYLAARLQGREPRTAAAEAHALSLRVIGHRGALMPMSALRGG